MNEMERVSFRVPEQLLEDVEALVQEGQFHSRSEAIRAAMRELTTDDPPTAQIVREDLTRGRGTFRWGDS